MRTRLAAAIVSVLLLLLLAPAATATASQVATVTPRPRSAAPSLAADGEALKGTLRSAAGRPVGRGRASPSAEGGSDVGTATTGGTEPGRSTSPAPGSYTVTLDVGSLPDGVQTARRSVGRPSADVTRPPAARHAS